MLQTHYRYLHLNLLFDLKVILRWIETTEAVDEENKSRNNSCDVANEQKLTCLYDTYSLCCAVQEMAVGKADSRENAEWQSLFLQVVCRYLGVIRRGKKVNGKRTRNNMQKDTFRSLKLLACTSLPPLTCAVNCKKSKLRRRWKLFEVWAHLYL